MLKSVILALALALMVSPASAQKKDPFSDRVAELEALVATLQTDLDALRGRVSTNEGDIATNASAIATNASGIAANGSAIATNAFGIATNGSGIATNGSGIATNASEIATLRDDVFGARLSSVASRLGDLEAIDHAGLQAQVSTNTSDIFSIYDTGLPALDAGINALNVSDASQNQKLFDLDIRALGHEEQATELLIRVLGLDEAIGIVDRVGIFRDSAIQKNVYDTFFALHGADVDFASIVMPSIQDWVDSILIADFKVNSVVCQAGLVETLSGGGYSVGCPAGLGSRFPDTDVAGLFVEFYRLEPVEVHLSAYFDQRDSAMTIVQGGGPLDLPESDALAGHLAAMYSAVKKISLVWGALLNDVETCLESPTCTLTTELDLFAYTALGSFEPVFYEAADPSACTTNTTPTKATIYGGLTFTSECS